MGVVPLIRGEPVAHKKREMFEELPLQSSANTHMQGCPERCSSQGKIKKKNSLSPGNNKEHAADACAGQQHVHPDVRRQGVQEGEDARIGSVGFAVQDADTQSHEGFGEVYDLLSDVGDGQGSHGEVRHLENKIMQTESARQAQE